MKPPKFFFNPFESFSNPSKFFFSLLIVFTFFLLSLSCVSAARFGYDSVGMSIRTGALGDCPSGQFVQNVTSGDVECATPAGGGDITAVIAGYGLMGGGDNADVTLNVSAETCGASEISKYNGTHFNCVTDQEGAGDSTWVANWTAYNVTWSTDLTYNDTQNISINNYIADVNTSMKNYVDSTFLTTETNWNANFTNMQTDCDNGNYSYGMFDNGTWKCRSDESAGYDDTWINDTFYNTTQSDAINTSINNYIAENNVSVNNYILYVNSTNPSGATDSTWVANWTAYNVTWSTDTDTWVANFSSYYTSTEVDDINTSVNNYIAQVNTSMKNYVDNTFLTTETNWNANFTNLLTDCPNGNYSYGMFDNGTYKCRDDVGGSYDDSWINETFYNRSDILGFDYYNSTDFDIADYLLISNWNATNTSYYLASNPDDFITNNTMNKTVYCGDIIGSPDTDFCTDETGAGGGNTTEEMQDAVGNSFGSGLQYDDTANWMNHSDTSSISDEDNSGNTFIQDITFDTWGHVQTLATAVVDVISSIQGYFDQDEELNTTGNPTFNSVTATSYFNASDWSDVSIMESQVSGLTYTIVNNQTCTGDDKFSAYDNVTGNFVCSTDQTGAGSYDLNITSESGAGTITDSEEFGFEGAGIISTSISGNNLTITGTETDPKWTANYTNMLTDCPNGNYSYGFFENGTQKCRNDVTGSSDANWNANFSAYNNTGWSYTFNQTQNDSINNWITENNASVTNWATDTFLTTETNWNANFTNTQTDCNTGNYSYGMFDNGTWKCRSDVSGAGGGNPFDQWLNTTDSPTFDNLTLTGNLTLAEKVTFTLSETIDNIINGWIRVTGGLFVTENINATNNITAGDYFIGNGSQLTDITTTETDPYWTANYSLIYTKTEVDDINTSTTNFINSNNDSITNTFGNYYTKSESDDINTSINNYIAEVNTSMKNYVDATFVSTEADPFWTANWTNVAFTNTIETFTEKITIENELNVTSNFTIGGGLIWWNGTHTILT